MWTVRKVCTKCNKLFTAPDKSMRQLCGSCIKYSYANAGTTNLKRNTYLLRTYNISDQDYRQLLHNQNGVCAICGRPPKRGTRLHVDHDHTGLRVRGLLCTGCNTRLGWYEAHKAGVDLYLRKR